MLRATGWTLRAVRWMVRATWWTLIRAIILWMVRATWWTSRAIVRTLRRATYTAAVVRVVLTARRVGGEPGGHDGQGVGLVAVGAVELLRELRVGDGPQVRHLDRLRVG
eukprot:5357643-Pyramimonas_sp.AAC.2